MKKILILSFILLSSCSLNNVVNHHGVHNLEQKQTKLKINYSNRNDIIKLIGPPSTKSTFDNDIYIYIERKTSNSKLTKLGKKKLIKNDVLVLEIDNTGILLSKKFYNKNDMNKIVFDENETGINYSKRSFIYSFLSSVRQKIDDPLGKKRIKN
ncbi:outer membrane protein assembly factor BamE [Candidatus Pelagibacter communis]|uniref:outer membrane protein assembly factor BamE n=1 Tax=Pelagibacter ubique TaxID=198252 RepID=UPI00094C5D79|nr:outer membrane protein assembly factor BamE [Candidatus Pelagibacter ubique]